MVAMWERVIFISFAAGLVILSLWYICFSRYNRRKAALVLKWLERSFEGHGELLGVEWVTTSTFLLRLKLLPALFRHTSVAVQLQPRQSPFLWLFARLNRKHESLTFEADLDVAPNFNLEVNNHRWCGRTRRRFPNSSEEWMIERTGPFVITTRNDWQREITNMMHGLVASRESDCLRVAFSRTSPHFSATLPLESISPESQSDTRILDVMRDLAAGASASRF